MAIFFSNNKSISIKQFSPEQPGRYPAVVVVHGSGGPRTAVEQYTPMLTRAGYIVFVLNYFESTGTTWATPALINEHFRVWLQVLKDGITYAATQAKVDTERIALMGVSLGAYLSLALATQDPRITAVIDIFGGMPEYFLERAERMPPVLVLHGEADSVVPVQEAYKLEALLKRLQTSYESKIYKGQGHGFGGMAALDAAQRIFSFLQKNLKAAVASKQVQ